MGTKRKYPLLLEVSRQLYSTAEVGWYSGFGTGGDGRNKATTECIVRVAIGDSDRFDKIDGTNEMG